MDEESRRAEATPSVAAVNGHPIHPMLVPFPIAFLVSAVATDIIFMANGDAFWARLSLWLLGIGVLTGLASAVFGLIDFLWIRRVRSIQAAWVHLIGNVAAVGLAFVNWLLRNNNLESHVGGWGLGLSIITMVILCVTGWLGGELAYRYRIGVASR